MRVYMNIICPTEDVSGGNENEKILEVGSAVCICSNDGIFARCDCFGCSTRNKCHRA